VTGATEEGPGQDEDLEEELSGRPDEEPGELHEIGGGIELVPLPRGVEPILSAEEALRAFENSWGILWRRYGAPQGQLMVGRNLRSYWDPAHGETFASAFTDRLVWVLAWRHFPACPTHVRPSRQVTKVKHRRPESAYVKIGVIDAMTGDVLAVVEEFKPDLGQ
jgi:hypothetical protein